MTEDQAKTKACCKGSEQTIQQNGSCIGSECMAWRSTGKERVAETKNGLTYGVDKPSGYCGLAGTP